MLWLDYMAIGPPRWPGKESGTLPSPFQSSPPPSPYPSLLTTPLPHHYCLSRLLCLTTALSHHCHPPTTALLQHCSPPNIPFISSQVWPLPIPTSPSSILPASSPLFLSHRRVWTAQFQSPICVAPVASVFAAVMCNDLLLSCLWTLWLVGDLRHGLFFAFCRGSLGEEACRAIGDLRWIS